MPLLPNSGQEYPLIDQLIPHKCSINDLPELIDRVKSFIQHSIGPDSIEIFLLKQNRELQLVAYSGLSDHQANLAENNAMDGNPGFVLKKGKLLYVPDVQKNITHALKIFRRGFIAESFLYVPIKIHNKAQGIIGLTSTKKQAFSRKAINVIGYLSIAFGDCYGNSIESTEVTGISSKNNKDNYGSFLKKPQLNASEMYFVIDVNSYRVHEVNSATKKILGFKANEIRGQLFSWFIHPDDKEETLRQINTGFLDGNQIVNFHNRVFRKNGQIVYLEWNAFSKHGVWLAKAEIVRITAEMPKNTTP